MDAHKILDLIVWDRDPRLILFKNGDFRLMARLSSCEEEGKRSKLLFHPKCPRSLKKSDWIRISQVSGRTERGYKNAPMLECRQLPFRAVGEVIVASRFKSELEYELIKIDLEIRRKEKLRWWSWSKHRWLKISDPMRWTSRVRSPLGVLVKKIENCRNGNWPVC